MPHYVCVSCHKVKWLEAHPTGSIGCAWCRQRLVHFGRESAWLSESARTQNPIRSPQDDWKGIPSRTLSNVMPDPAVLEAETLLLRQPDNVDALLYLARRAKTDRDWVRARVYFKRLYRLFPNHPQLIHDMAEVALLEGDSKSAVDLLATALVQDGKDATAHYNIAIGLHRLGADIDRVVTHLMACESLEPDSAIAQSARILLQNIGASS